MAGIYIPSMVMPQYCGDCPMCDLNWELCRSTRKEIENVYADDGVAVFCPLVPVPDHGRLIDADALIEQKEWAFDGVGQTEMVNVAEIVNAPTILPADKEVTE